MAAGTAENNIERRENKLLALGSAGAALAGHDLIDPHGRTLGALRLRRSFLLEVMGMFESRADMVAKLLFGLPCLCFGRRVRFTIIDGPLGRIREDSIGFEDAFQLFCGGSVIWVSIRMILKDHPAKGVLDFSRRSAPFYPEERVVIDR